MPIFRPRNRRRTGAESGTLSRRPLNAVRRSLLTSALACGRSALPNEFGGILRSDEPGVITELLLLPGTTAGHRHANLSLWMVPADFTAVGTVHSHPSGALHPSSADLQLFRHWGLRHMILGNPFAKGCWRAYDANGNEVHLDVVEDEGDALPARPRAFHRPLGAEEEETSLPNLVDEA